MKTYNQTLRTPFVFLVTLVYSLFLSCSSDDDATTLSSEKEILQFTVSGGTTGTINHDTNTITVTVPFGTDVTSVTPALSISENATYSPTGAQDFSSPVVYTITAQDGTEVQYTINVVPTSNAETALLSFVFIGEDNAFEEDIEEVRWMSPKEVYHALEHSYKSISYVFERYYDKTEMKSTGSYKR